MDAPFPKYVEWQITAKCQNQCLHCNNIPGNAVSDLSTSAAIHLIHQLVDEGVKSVTLSGGEPFARDDWELLAGVLIENRISVQFISNGGLLGNRQVVKLKSLGVDFVWLSLDGPKSVHNFIRQDDRSFDAVIHAAALLREMNVPFGFMTTLLRPNYQMLIKMADLVSENRAALWQLWLGNRTNHREIWLSASEINELLPTLPTIRLKASQMIVGDNIGYSQRLEYLRTPGFTAPQQRFHFRGCFGGKEVIGIRHNGAMQNCLALSSTPTHRTVTDLPIQKLHQLALGNYRAIFQTLERQCAQCENYATCAKGCPAHRLSQSTFGEVPYCYIQKRNRHSIAQTVSASVLAACAISTPHCHLNTSDSIVSPITTAASDHRNQIKPSPDSSKEHSFADKLDK